MSLIRRQDSNIFERKYTVDLNLDEEDLTLALAQQFELLAPFGSKNRKPSIELDNTIISDVRYMGDRQQHARFSAQSSASGAKIQCVLFGRAQDVDLSGNPACLIGNLDLQVWQGAKRLQFMVEEIRRNTV
ncbi:MAG: hypothetical protein ACLTK0_04415 [Anaerovoracaceae bacterium]